MAGRWPRPERIVRSLTASRSDWKRPCPEKGKEADERVTLLETATARSVRDKEEIQALTARVRELDDSLREEKAAHEASRSEKEEAEGLLEVTFEEAIYMAWCKDKSMNLLVFPDPESKRAEFEAKEKEDVELLADEA